MAKIPRIISSNKELEATINKALEEIEKALNWEVIADGNVLAERDGNGDITIFGIDPAEVRFRYEGHPILKNIGGVDKLFFSDFQINDINTGAIFIAHMLEVDYFDFAASVEGDEFYLKHETDLRGNTTNAEFVKFADGEFDPNVEITVFVSGVTEGVYFRKIAEITALEKEDSFGNIGAGDPTTPRLQIQVFRSFGIDWDQALGSSSSVSSSSSSSSSSPSSSVSSSLSSVSSSVSQSSKSLAIVPAPWLGEGCYVALYVEEQPEVIFSDWFDIELTGRESRFDIDYTYYMTCEPNSIKVTGISTDEPSPVGAKIDHENKQLVIKRRWFSKVKRVTGRLSGIRLGFAGVRLELKTEHDFKMNEERLKRSGI